MKTNEPKQDKRHLKELEGELLLATQKAEEATQREAELRAQLQRAMLQLEQARGLAAQCAQEEFATRGALRDLDLRDILGLDTNPGRSPVAAHWCDLAPMHCVWRGAGVDSPLSKLVAAGVPVPGAQM